MTELQLQEFKKCAESPEYFIRQYVKVNHPSRGLVDFKLHNFQERVLLAYEKQNYNIVLKFRQSGITTLSVIYGLWLCMFRLDRRVLFLSKSDREARYAGKFVKCALQHLPDWLLPEIGKQNDHCVEFVETNSRIEFFAMQASCGRATDLMVIDEAAFIPNMEEHWKALYPVLTGGSSCIVNSTSNGRDNWFYRTFESAKNGTNSFNPIHIHYTEHPEYNNEAWANQVRKNLGPKGWAQEIEGRFDYDEEAQMIGEVNQEDIAYFKKRLFEPLKVPAVYKQTEEAHVN